MLTVQPSLDQFTCLAGSANTIPVYAELLSDQLTPVSAFACLAQKSPHAFLLESVVGGEKIARYSFLAVDPRGVFTAKRDRATYQCGDQAEDWTLDDPLAKLGEILATHTAVHLPELPRFVGGAVGYAGFDVVRYHEHLPDAPTDDRDLPDLYFGLYDAMVVFDHVKKRLKIVVHAHLEGHDPMAAYQRAVDRVQQIAATLSNVPPAPLLPMNPAPNHRGYQSNFARPDFEKAVDRCKEYIRAGDVFQVVISQRLKVDTTADPFDIYRALRAVNPSPFMFYLKSPNVTLVGASPEILCRVEDGVVTSRPLAGTRPRGRNEAEDLGLERELLADPKERAEHVMLVDLGRNDVGRVARLGSVKLDDLMTVERYAHVMHISSNVVGELRQDCSALDALRAVLPVGTVSGAPKLRAIEIIDELEPTRRGPYGGAVGYLDFAGNMDTCIALRTLVITEPVPGQYNVFAQVGAGIVADSEPAREYEETMHKAASMLAAIDMAHSWTAPDPSPPDIS